MAELPKKVKTELLMPNIPIMCLENKINLCQLYNSAATLHNINGKLLSQLLTLLSPGGKISHRSSTTSPRRRTRLSSIWLTLGKILEEKIKLRKNCLNFSKIPNNLRYTDVRSSSTIFNNAKLKKEKVPIVILKDVLTTQGRISKSDFMEYFRLQESERVPQNTLNTPNTGAVKFSQAVNVPISSNLGMVMAARENHVLAEDFKLRKIERSEWYVNRPFDKKEEVNYPITYVNKKVKKTSNRNSRNSRVNSGRVQQMLRLCKPVSVVLERLDLLRTQKKILANTKRRKMLRSKCKPVKVILEVCEKKKAKVNCKHHIV